MCIVCSAIIVKGISSTIERNIVAGGTCDDYAIHAETSGESSVTILNNNITSVTCSSAIYASSYVLDVSYNYILKGRVQSNVIHLFNTTGIFSFLLLFCDIIPIIIILL